MSTSSIIQRSPELLDNPRTTEATDVKVTKTKVRAGMGSEASRKLFSVKTQPKSSVAFEG